MNALVAEYSRSWWFPAVWLLTSIVAIGASVAWARIDGSARAAHVAPNTRRAGRLASEAASATIAAGVALVAFVSLYAFLICYHEDLIGLDYAQLTAARFVGMPIWASTGRFFPLALQEYNLLALVGKSAGVYHGFSVLELMAVLLCAYRVLDEAPPWFRCLTLMFVMMLPSVVASFFGLVYPERDTVLWLALWLVCLQSFARTGNRGALCGALIAAQFILYYKETAFFFVGGFAAARLLLTGWQDARLLQRGQYALFTKRHVLEIAHLCLAAVFVATYLVAIVPRIEASYAINAKSAGAAITALRSYVETDLVLDALVVAVVWRTVALIASKRAPDPLWDALALGALAFALAYVKLGMMREYYMAPADFIATLYLARLAYRSLRAERRLVGAGVAVAVGLVFVRNGSDAAYRIRARESYVDANVQLASALKGYAASQPQATMTLFFPQVGGFQLMEFSAFLQYKGLRLAAHGTTSPTVVVESSHRFPDNRCHPSQYFQCVYAPAPEPGALVVYLPGSPPSASDLDALSNHANLIVHVQPHESAIERALRALVAGDRVPDLTPNAYVFKY